MLLLWLGGLSVVWLTYERNPARSYLGSLLPSGLGYSQGAISEIGSELDLDADGLEERLELFDSFLVGLEEP